MNEGERLRTTVVCAPGPAYSGVTDPAAENITGTPDSHRASAQHRALVETLEAFGTRVVVVDEPPGWANATFTRDAALVTRAGYVRLRMGLPSRRAEPEWLAGVLEGLGLHRAGAVVAPGQVEGGDVVLAGDVALVGRSGRTNPDGIAQLTSLLEPLGYEVRVAGVPGGHLHLGGALSVVGPRRLVTVAGVFDAGFLAGFDVVDLPARPGRVPGANVICLGPDEVVANAADGLAPVEALESRGIRVHRLDLSEFRKGCGGPTCMVLPVERG